MKQEEEYLKKEGIKQNSLLGFDQIAHLLKDYLQKNTINRDKVMELIMKHATKDSIEQRFIVGLDAEKLADALCSLSVPNKGYIRDILNRDKVMEVLKSKLGIMRWINHPDHEPKLIGIESAADAICSLSLPTLSEDRVEKLIKEYEAELLLSLSQQAPHPDRKKLVSEIVKELSHKKTSLKTRHGLY